ISCYAEDVVYGLSEFEGQHGLYPNAMFISDKGSHFISTVLEEFCHLKGITHRFTITYSPFTNGTIERPNREILAVLRSLLSQHRLSIKFWSKLVNIVES